MKNITVKMKDLLTENEEIITRVIDISNFQVPDYSAPCGWECDRIEDRPEKQRELLERWIDDRASAQHETILELVSWSID